MNIEETGLVAGVLALAMGLIEVIKQLVRKKTNGNGGGSLALVAAFEAHAKEDISTLKALSETQGTFVEVARRNGEKLDELNHQIQEMRDTIVRNGAAIDSILRRVDK